MKINLHKGNVLYIVILVSFFFFNNCGNKLENRNNKAYGRPSSRYKIEGNFSIEMLEQLDRFWTSEVLTRGDFNIQKYNHYYEGKFGYGLAEFRGVVYDGKLVRETTKDVIFNGEWLIGEESVNKVDESNRYDVVLTNEQFWGKENVIALKGKKYEGFKDNIFIPNEIFLYTPVPQNDSSQYSYQYFGDDIKLTWNSDERNDKGVLIRVSPGGVFPEKEQIEGKKGLVILAADNGSYTITTPVLQELGFDQGDEFAIEITRGNFKYIPSFSGKETYGFFAITTSEVFIKFWK